MVIISVYQLLCEFCKINTFHINIDLPIDDMSNKHYIKSKCIFYNSRNIVLFIAL